MPGGWGGYKKPRKTKQQIALERRRELGNKFFSPIEELEQLVAKSRVKVKRLPCVPPEDPAIASARTDPDAPSRGPCQDWIEGHRRWREAGKPRGKVVAPKPPEARVRSRRSRRPRRS